MPGTVCNNELPSRMSRDQRRAFEQMGIVFDDQLKCHPGYIRCALLSGWKKNFRHRNEMELLDEQARVRAVIFDDTGNQPILESPSIFVMTIYRFLSYTALLDHSEGGYYGQVWGGGIVLYKSKTYTFSSFRGCQKLAEQDALEWMKKNYPDYNNPAAYWD